MKKLLCLISFLSIYCQAIFSIETNLNVSGDLHSKWHYIDENTKSHNFIIESNFVCNYLQIDSWMEAKVKLFLESLDYQPFTPTLTLERAYIGFNLCDSIFLEIGRNNLDNMFDSKVQYKSHFNGVHLGFTRLNFHVHGGVYLEDIYYNKLAAILEISRLDMFNTNVNLLYSLTYHKDDLISQVTVKYPFQLVDELGIKVLPYFAYLYNHDQNANGFYLGATFGEVNQAKDFIVDVNYQEFSEIPYHDMAGIAKGVNVKSTYAITDKVHAKCKASFTKGKQAYELAMIYNW